ncbi:PD-(D/E)XK nuclease domain-containing protein [Wolbachia endosymbiont of Pentidionis agamae]|uniref:PD-(D/E)XK nuclease domain-containing protein n=1 Tax=Wolbachia endosymbiont of Pentidionis agamae TaxID=3110435 RepID=UPI002FD61F7A
MLSSELFKLFLSNDKQDCFQKKFNQIISEVPKKIAGVEGFWSYFFLGAILTLPYIVKKKVRLKLSNDQKTIKFIYIDEEKSVVRIKIVSIDEKVEFSKEEVNFLKRKIQEEYSIDLEDENFIKQTVYYINKGQSELVMKINDAKKVSIDSVSGTSFIHIKKILDVGQEIREFNTLLEKLDQPFVKQAAKIKSIEDLFLQLGKIYNYYKNKLKLKDSQEALFQAFIYGFFKMHGSDKIKCLTEFSAGLGYADLVLMIDQTVIIVELKVDNKTADQAKQQIENRGYIHSNILNQYENIYLVGVNFTKDTKEEQVKVESYEKSQYEGLVNLLMSEEDLENKVLNTKISKELEYLCNTKNIGISNPNNPSNKNESNSKNKCIGSFTALLFGQAVQYRLENNLNIEVTGPVYLKDRDAINTMFKIDNLEFDITEYKDKGGNISPAHSSDTNSQANIYNIEIKIKKNDEEYKHKIEFISKKVNSPKKANSSTNNSSHGLRDRSTLQTPAKYKDENFISTLSRSSSHLQCNEYETQICIKLLEDNCEMSPSTPRSPNLEDLEALELPQKNVKEIIQDIKNPGKSNGVESLQELVKKVKLFINSEANLQLFLRGLFLHSTIELDDDEEEKVIVETEVSVGRAGNADLLLKLPDGTGIIMELKFCDTEKEIKGKIKEAERQLTNYTNQGILKDIVDINKLKKFYIVFCKENSQVIVKNFDNAKARPLSTASNDSYDSALGDSLSESSSSSVSYFLSESTTTSMHGRKRSYHRSHI